MSQLNSDLAGLNLVCQTYDEFLATLDAQAIYTVKPIWVASTVMNELTNGALAANGFGLIVRHTSAICDFFFSVNSGRAFYAGRYTNNATGAGITYLGSYSATTVYSNS